MLTNGINNKVDLKESLIGKIVSIFADAPPRKDIRIFADEVFAEAKVRLEEMAETARLAYYEDTFDERLERLRTCFYNTIHPNSVTPSCGTRI